MNENDRCRKIIRRILLVVDIPDFDGPICRTTNEDLRMETIPAYSINSHMMSIESIQKLIIVRFRTFVNLSFFCSNNKQIVLLFIKVKTCATTYDKAKHEIHQNRNIVQLANRLPSVVNGTAPSVSSTGCSNFNCTIS